MLPIPILVCWWHKNPDAGSASNPGESLQKYALTSLSQTNLVQASSIICSIISNVTYFVLIFEDIFLKKKKIIIIVLYVDMTPFQLLVGRRVQSITFLSIFSCHAIFSFFGLYESYYIWQENTLKVAKILTFVFLFSSFDSYILSLKKICNGLKLGLSFVKITKKTIEYYFLENWKTSYPIFY